MEKIGVLIATITCLMCFGFNVGMCSSESDALIKTYVSSSLPSNDDLFPSAMLKIIEIYESEWDSRLIQSELPVMVMFTANWCGPCRIMKPIVDKLDSDFTDRFKFYILDTDKSQAIVDRCSIRALPTFIVFKGGVEVARVSGADPSELRRIVEKYV